MGKKAPSIEQITEILGNQVLVGRACLTVAQGIWNADPVVRATAPTFFGLALEGNLQLAQIHAARLYDKTTGAVSIYSLISEAKKWAAGLPEPDGSAALQGICDAESRIAGIEPNLISIEKRRNEALAHLDQRTVRDPKRLDALAPLTVPELSKVLTETGNIISEIGVVYRGVASNFEFLDVEDYKMALSLISDAKCARIEKYEKEFGVPAPFDRPANCPKSS